MVKWTAGLALLGALVAGPSFAAFITGDALVIGNAAPGDGATGFGPAEVQQVAHALRLRGQEVEALANGGHDAMAQAVGAFSASISEDETPLIVVLSGVFAQGADGVYLQPSGPQQGTAQPGLSLSAVLDVLAQSPRRAFLVLGETGPDIGPDSGLATLDIPDGVTVIRGPSDQVAQFAAGEMAHPGTRLTQAAEGYDLIIAGHTADSLVVLEHTEVRPPTEAEQAAARDRARQVDDLAWQRAQGGDSAAAYRAYLDSFPQGRHADRAKARITEAALALNVTARRAIQRDLAQLGFDTRGIDGIFGPRTRGSIAAWQNRNGADVTGYLDAAQIAQLADLAAAQAPQDPVAATPPVRQPARNGVSAQETATWGRARGETGLRLYLGQYPNGAHAQRARVLLSNIQRGFGQ
ncbi:peptidoglycan-binding domain-containing protein [Antarctobacter heliothermus]|uniref:Putative peptidoglycan binding domain-containing protein n=1 Tax=Antarctobacter heliothermus TaxID=74033 RepID=A0A239J767_9RHOB|nr:peptidoglycan-binding domain-containing protein [Antarctobacter heliothermus]SNT01866.1 Putative peptidoglycan binding domain-containing protein [Antarctobacter heliothermus]